MFDRFNTPEEIFSFKLGTALTMERTSLSLLEELQGVTNRDEIRAALAEHAEETRGHIRNIEEAFGILGEEVKDHHSPAVDGLAKEGKAAIKKTDDAIVDAVVLDGARAVEHHEIATYETLVDNAEARGEPRVAALLRTNLEQEIAASKTVNDLGHRIAREGYSVLAVT